MKEFAVKDPVHGLSALSLYGLIFGAIARAAFLLFALAAAMLAGAALRVVSAGAMHVCPGTSFIPIFLFFAGVYVLPWSVAYAFVDVILSLVVMRRLPQSRRIAIFAAFLGVTILPVALASFERTLPGGPNNCTSSVSATFVSSTTLAPNSLSHSWGG